MDNEVKEEVKVEEPKKKRNGLFTLFACVMTGIIVFLATNIGQKASKVVNPETKGSKGSNVTSNIESNATSNVESNATSNATTDKIEVTLNKEAVDGQGNEFAKVVATKNGVKAWEYTTGSYAASELNTFTLYEGEKYVYLAEDGKVKAFDKTTGKLAWANDTDNGRGVQMLEVNGRLVVTGYYSNLITRINVANGTTIASHKNTICSKVIKITYASSTRVIMQCEQGQLEYDLSTGVMYK